ncbi:hypothetical protein CRYUN_Cryun01aG0034700 [Craigia yunnanensis]
MTENRLRDENKPYIGSLFKDMLAFTGCSHNLTKAEEKQLRQLSHSVRHWKEKRIDGEERRRQVAGKIYGQDGVKALEEKYPNVHILSNLATEEELMPFTTRQNQLAAVDLYCST